MNSKHQPGVRVARSGSIAIVTLYNPDKRNACGHSMREQLLESLKRLESDDSCRAIVITGEGDHFCAGGDISEMEQRDLIAARLRMETPTAIFRLLATGPKPVITAVEGNAHGCGVSLVACSDYAVAASDAKFCCAFMRVGLIPDFGGLWSIARRIGHRKAMELCAFAEVYTAEDALDMQLVNRVVSPGAALEHAMEAAHKFARNPPVANALLRAALNAGCDTIDGTVATEVDYLGILQGTTEFAGAVDRFRSRH